MALWRGLSGDTAFKPRLACQGKPDLQRSEGRGDQAMRKDQGQGRSTHSKRGEKRQGATQKEIVKVMNLLERFKKEDDEI